MRNPSRTLAVLEDTLRTLQCRHALTQARAAGSQRFAEVLLARLPAGLDPEYVWCDLDAMTNAELKSLSAWQPGKAP